MEQKKRDSPTMQNIGQNRGRPVQVYDFWHRNLARFDEAFLAALPIVFHRAISTNQPGGREFVAAVFAQFGNLIQQFPLDLSLGNAYSERLRGERAESIKAAIAAIATFSDSKILPYKNATVAAVSEAIGQAAIVYFSCHGSADFNEPLTSGLRMHDGLLTLRNLFDLKLTDIRLALLSACDTGLPGLELADEAIGLPVGLLQVGVAGTDI